MKKIQVLVILFALVVSCSSMALASSFNMVGGLTYNTFTYESWFNGEKNEWTPDMQEVVDDLSKGPGFYVGGELWVNDFIALGAGLDSAMSTWQEVDTIDGHEVGLSLSNINIGPYASLAFRFAKILKIHADVAYYFHDTQSKVWVDSESQYTGATGSGLGVLLGGQATLPVTDTIDIFADCSYRKLRVAYTEVYVDETSTPYDQDEQLDLSGLRVGVGINFKF